MNKTKSCWRFLSLVLTIILIAAFFPSGIFAEASGDNDLWMTENVLTSPPGTLIPMITFSDDVFYNGSSEILAEVSPAASGPDIDPTLVEITYTGMQVNGDSYSESTIPPTNAGTYSVIAKYAGDDFYESCSETKEIKIKPVELQLVDFYTEKPITRIYNGAVDVPENIVIGLRNTKILKDDVNDVMFNFKSASFFSKDVKSVDPNTVTLKNVTITGEKGQNYLIVEDDNVNKITEQEKKETKRSETLEPKMIDVVLSASITPKPVEVFLSGQNKVYDGNAVLHDYDVVVNQDDIIKGEEIGVFTTADFSPWYGEKASQKKDVGNYCVWASGGYFFYGINGTNADNYQVKDDPISSKEKYNITPALISVVPSYQSKVEGDSDPVLTYTVWRDESGTQLTEGLYGEDVLWGALIREEGEDIGTYDVFLGSLNNPNYYISLLEGEDKFEIIKKGEVVQTYNAKDGYNPATGSGADEEKAPVAYFGIALLALLLIVGGIFFGKNRLTKME